MISILVLLALATPQARELQVDFKVSGTEFSASLISIGECGLVRIEAEPTKGNTLAYLDVIEDFSFKGLRLRAFGIEDLSSARVVMAEYYQTSWVYTRFFVVTKSYISEVLWLSHRSTDNVRLTVDKSGNLTRLVFEDRWAGRPHLAAAEPGALRWHLVTSYIPKVATEWKPQTSVWKLKRW